MKKILSMMACLSLAVTLTACGGDDDEPENTPAPGTPEQLATPTPSADMATVTESSFTITWPVVAGASTYSYTVNAGQSKTTTETELYLSDLQPETTYEIRVKALSGDTTRYTDSEWGVVTVTTLPAEEPEPTPGPGTLYEGVLEGAYHVPSYWDEETGVISEYNTFQVMYDTNNTYYIGGLLNYPFPWEAIYDHKARELVVTGNIIYENNAGEIVTENIFNKICAIYTPEESGIGIWIGCIPRGIDEGQTGADPFRMGVDNNGYLYVTKSYLADVMYELEMAPGSTASNYQVTGIGNMINYRSLISKDINIAQGEAPEVN